MTHDPMQFYIPRRLDDQSKFLFWDWDVALVFLAVFSFGILLGQMLLMTIVAIFPAYLYAKSKSGKHPGFASHMVYWHIGQPSMKETPQSYYRELIG